MIKKALFAGLGLALLATPLFASAQSADVQAQIASLLAQIKALQAQIAQLQGGSVQSNCVNISSNLTLGSSGDDVTNLQNYLIGSGVLDSQYSTGYYGFITAQAVGKMQMNLGILSSANDPAYGITGPKTRAAIQCGGTKPIPTPVCTTMAILACPSGTHPGGKCNQECIPDNTSANFSASPTSGPVPLTVTFKITTGDSFIDFGDNTDPSTCANSHGGDCFGTGVQHVYTVAGTYSARLYKSDYVCGNGENKDGSVSYGCSYQNTGIVQGTATITVTGGTTGDAAVSVSLSDPTGHGKETFSSGETLGIGWTTSRRLGTDPQYQTGIDLFPYGADPANTVTTRIVRTDAAAPPFIPWTVTSNGLFGDTVNSGRYMVQVDVYDPQKGGYVVGQAGPISINITTPDTGTPTISGATTYNSTTGSRMISITYAHVPTTNIQGIFLASTVTGTNVASMPAQGGSRTVFLPVPDASPAGNYVLRILAVTNNQTIVESAPFYVGPVGGSNTTSTFNATPTSGAAPLTVTFTGVGSSISFGDGTPGMGATCSGSASAACTIDKTTHTYTSSGIYTATSNGASVTITVTGGSTSGPKVNAMSCAKPPQTGLSDGTLACYGLWDYGNEFGDDQNMCPVSGYSSGSTGCVVKTTACQSGAATATRLVNVISGYGTGGVAATASDIATYAQNLNSNTTAVQKQLIRVWEYTCGNPTSPPLPTTGSLTISAGTQPANTLAPQGAIVPFTNFILTNNTQNIVTVNGITLQKAGIGSDAVFANVAILDQSGAVVAGPAQINPSTHQVTLGDTFSIPAGQTKTLTVYGYMAQSLSAYAGQIVGLSVVAISTNTVVSGSLPITGAINTINSTLTNFCSQPQVYGYKCWGTGSTTGTLSVSTDASSPSYALATGGSTGVVLGAYRVYGAGEAINLSKVTLNLTSGSSGDLTNVYLYSGSALLGSGVFIGGNKSATITLNTPYPIPADRSITLTAKGDFAAIGTSQPGVPGDLIQVDYQSAQGTGASSGLTIQATGSTNVAGVRIFKSYPIVALDSLPNDGVADGKLMRFKVSALPPGEIGIKQFTFRTNANGAIVANATLYGYTDASYSQAIAGQGSAGQIGQSIPPSNNTSFAIKPTSAPVEIPAGATYYFELRGPVALSSNTPAAVTTSLLGDATFAATMNPVDLNSFIWSPNDNTTSQFSDADWTNGYGIPGLPASGISQTRTGSGGSGATSTSTSASTQDQNANLAAALVALESVLKSLIALLQH